MITESLLTSFKNRMKISHSIEDETLKEILSASVDDITSKCGTFDVETHKRARELVLERSRYVYNDGLEFFDTNFLPQILSLSVELYEPSEVVE